MSYTISELRNNVFSKVFETYDIIKEYFGERFTDLQGVPTEESFKESIDHLNILPKGDIYEITDYEKNRLNDIYSSFEFYIYVWWPHVIVSNENNKSIDIDDLYASIRINIKGLIPYVSRGFKLTRSTFSYTQYMSGYMHSHTPRFYDTPKFEEPCLGTGPIKNTILSLHTEWSEITWMLFCRELDLYVTVESLAGGPYYRLEEVGLTKSMYIVDIIQYSIYNLNSVIKKYHINNTTWVKNFILYYLKNGHVSFGYKNRAFTLSLPAFDYMVDISNCFINWFNSTKECEFSKEDLFACSLLLKTFVINNKFYIKSNYNYSSPSLSNTNALLFHFKGKEIRLNIKEQNTEDKTEEALILCPEFSYAIINYILKIINYKYINEHYIKYNDSSTAESSPISENVIYV